MGNGKGKVCTGNAGLCAKMAAGKVKQQLKESPIFFRQLFVTANYFGTIFINILCLGSFKISFKLKNIPINLNHF